ncbi:MAG: hypothetical protein AB1397_03185 [bacterium]
MKKLLALAIVGLGVGLSNLWGDEQGVMELKGPEILEAGTYTFLSEEAGIAGWINLGQQIDLSQAKGVFVGLEKEENDYIIGSIRPSGYLENENAEIHCFVHKDGWILTYYTKDVPRAKIFDYRAYKQDQSKVVTMLWNGIHKVCEEIGIITPSEISYYDFKHPNANRLMLIVDGKWEEGWEFMHLTIPNEPGTLTVYETSWSHTAWDSDGSTFEVDDVQINNFGSGDNKWQWREDKFSPSLSLGDKHKIELWHNEYGGYKEGEAFLTIAIIYYEKE